MARVGALGDLLLTRRLTFSLFLAGFRTTLLAPARHASLLLGDPWVDTVLDSESARFASVFAGSWPEEAGFDLGLVISNSKGLAEAVRRAATQVIRIPPGPERADVSIARQWADAAQPACKPFTGTLPRLGTAPGDAVVTGATLLHPGSGSPSKNWPVERFMEVGQELSSLGHRVIWLRGPAEAGFPESIPSDQIVDRPPLHALAATLGQSRLYVGNDSGVSHLAAAVGTASVVVFGPTSAMVWRPDGPSVRTVIAEGSELSNVRVSDVLAAAKEMAGSSPSGPL
ncbi:MAG: glycosyltransferase family 9 protein [Vicinamibacteria bacterium]|nr:glycosyltransferase family 9 protein [Vicinamibacteria bacterium]